MQHPFHDLPDGPDPGSARARGACSIASRVSFTALLALLLAAGACSKLTGTGPDKTANWSPSQLYGAAKKALDARDYLAAVDLYKKLEARYPFGGYAEQAQLEIAYAYYKEDEADAALAAANRFIKLHPRHEHVDYAYYLKGLVNFNRDRGLLARLLPGDPSERDPGAAFDSFQDFAELAQRFPESRYAPDARQRMLYLRNNLAQHEVNVARFYMARSAFVAAANRAKHVVETFPTTPSVPDALVIMAKAYKILQLEELSSNALRVLKLNHPQHPGIAEIERFAPR